MYRECKQTYHDQHQQNRASSRVLALDTQSRAVTGAGITRGTCGTTDVLEGGVQVSEVAGIVVIVYHYFSAFFVIRKRFSQYSNKCKINCPVGIKIFSFQIWIWSTSTSLANALGKVPWDVWTSRPTEKITNAVLVDVSSTVTSRWAFFAGPIKWIIRNGIVQV